jgi:hypothetical protein
MSKMIKSLITIALFSQPLTMYSAVYSSPPNLVEVVNKMKIKKMPKCQGQIFTS